MNKFTWLLANCVLLVAAYGVTAWVRGREPGASWAFAESEMAESDKSVKRGATRAAEPPDSVPPEHSLQSEDFDELWKRTLFRPERTEETAATGAEGEVEKQAPAKVSMELVGVGKIGDKPVAIILEKAPPRRSFRRRFPISRHSRSDTEAKKDGASAKTQHIYREGETVGKTGYVVSKIDFDRVLLTRGGEELTLKLEAGDDQSRSRREKAVASAKSRAAARAQEKKTKRPSRKQGGSPGAPPPPPPPPVAGPGVPPCGRKPPVSRTAAKTSRKTAVSPAAMSREERLRRAKLLRERILQQRQKELEDKK